MKMKNNCQLVNRLPNSLVETVVNSDMIHMLFKESIRFECKVNVGK